MSADEDSEVGPAKADGELGVDLKRPSFLIAGVGVVSASLDALTGLLRCLPEDAGVSLVLILQLGPERASAVLERLQRVSRLPIQEASQGLAIERNHVYVLPPGSGMTVQGGALWLHPRPSGAAQKPVDSFFLSLAADQGRNAMGVLLSSTDDDGIRGLHAIKDAEGATFAQDTPTRNGAPRASIAAGVVDFVGSPEAIAGELVRLAREFLGVANEAQLMDGASGAESILSDEDLRSILELLYESTGVDFASYKPNTVRRRILRRMAIHRIPLGAKFLELLRENPTERQALQKDILIHVTHFFRDPEAFAALSSLVIPQLIASTDRSHRDPLRIWVPGCATGEEVYSIAICILEALGQAPSTVSLQVFGTDLSASAIATARAGVYSHDIASDVSPERLQRFFMRVEAGYQVRKNVRDACVFAPHDITRDPPFSRMDLISCRNVLIYMGAPLQKRVIPLLHYGLNAHGYLLLGPAESIGSFTELFTTVDKRWRLYQKVEGAARPALVYTPAPRPIDRAGTLRAPKLTPGLERDVRREADRILSKEYVPPAVIVNEQMEVLHFLGRTAPYLEPSSGKATYHVLSMATEGLRAAIATAVRSALEGNGVSEERAHLESADRDVKIRVHPLGLDATERNCLLVVFEDPESVSWRAHTVVPPMNFGPESTAAALARARAELEALQQQLQSIVEGHEAAQEELQSANEEVLSGNEELQSTNEELQTSKEEVESTNEELSTVNDELQARVSELTRLNDDWTNVLASVQIPFLILSSDLRIRSFTPAAATIFRVIGTDIGRPLSDINIGLRVADLPSILTNVLETLQAKTEEVQDHSGRWYQLRVRPYRTTEDRIDGVILALIDIDEMKRGVDAISDARDFAEAIIATVRRPLLVLDSRLRVRTANPEFYRTFAISREQVEGHVLYELGNRQWDIPELRRVLQEVIPRDQHFDDFEVEHLFPSIGRRIMRINARRVESTKPNDDQILVAIDDVTERRDQERGLLTRDRELVQADERKNEFLAMLAHELRNPLAPIMHAGSLLRRTQGLEPRIVERSAEIIVRQSTQMARLIEDLLDVARITRGTVKLQRQRVALQVVAEAAAEAARPSMEARRHQFVVSLPLETIEVDVDPARLQQIISNLLSNAAKYTEPGGRVELAAERVRDTAVIRVRDNGVGIPQDILPMVFELFMQAERNLDRASGGLGIGLTVARSLVEMHGGTIEARSTGAGEGSELTVRLPVCPPLETSILVAAEDAPGALAAQTPRRVLIVESDEDSAELLASLLRHWGHDVRVAHDGSSAVEIAAALGPEVALLDVGLPGSDGNELPAALRRISAGIFLVAITGYGQADEQDRWRAVGFDRHCVKPVRADVLATLLSTLGLK